jgi:putative PIN family toxin of toxin-antitoxin system
VRIVLDTNVLIAALIARGFCHELFEYCIQRHTLVASDFIFEELREKLVGKFKYNSELADEAVTLLRSKMEVVTPARLDAPVCRDPDDDNILATAVTGNCEVIITGDKDLLVLKRFGNVEILSPSGFQKYERSG